MMKRGTIFLLLLVLALGLLVAAAVSILHDGLSARAQPSALEAAIARNARKMAIPANAHNTKNPIPDSPEVQREARLHFADHCAICHGNDGSGDTQIGHGLYPKPPDLRADETQLYPAFASAYLGRAPRNGKVQSKRSRRPRRRGKGKTFPERRASQAVSKARAAPSLVSIAVRKESAIEEFLLRPKDLNVGPQQSVMG